MKFIKRTILLAALAVYGMSTGPANAGEGGSSHYLQGTYGDFQAGIFGPAGLYYRNDLFLYKADIEARPLGGAIDLGVEQELWLNLGKLIYLTDETILGARYGAAITIPYVLNVGADAAASAGGASLFASGDISGLGDIYINPILLNWTSGSSHFTFAPGITAPTGRYSDDRLLNTGRNYWTFDLAGTYTWFDPAQGTDISVTAGVMFNTENPDTDYTTGTELHIDWLVGQFVSPTLGIGLAGYYYQQFTGDEGNLAAGPVDIDVSDFRGRGLGLGPAIITNVTVGETSVSLIGKALFDLDSEKRFEGDIYMLSGAFKF